jgi:hypothetical protein
VVLTHLEAATAPAAPDPSHAAAASTSPLGPLTWETWARVTDQHRRSIELQRNQEFAYYRELASPLAVNEVVRGYMFRSLERIQASIQAEERALEQWQAQYWDNRVTEARDGARCRITTRAATYKPTDVDDDV